MSKMLIKLNDVSLEETIALRRLLDEHGIDYYETSAGNWGVSVAAIWLKDPDQLKHATELLQQHHLSWAEHFMASQEQQGPTPSLWQNLRHQPVKVISLSLLLAAIVYLTLSPFLGMI